MKIMELLAKLLGGIDRVKIMRFFLHHDEDYIPLHDISEKTKIRSDATRRELTALVSVGFVERKKSREFSSGGKKGSRIKEVMTFKLNKEFPHNQALKDLLFDFETLDKRELANRFRLIGRIKLFIVSGLFIGSDNSRVDILIVGEAIKRPKAEKVFEVLSAELGREVHYSIMDTEEFDYRNKMYDKFVRDIMDMPHEKVFDRMKANG